MSSLGGGACYLSLTWDFTSCDSEWFLWMSIVRRVNVTVRPVLIAILVATTWYSIEAANHPEPPEKQAMCAQGSLHKMIC